MKYKIITLFAAIALLLSVSAINLSAGEQSKVMVVKFHADWCGTCRASEDSVKDLMARFESKGVSFVVIDYTDGATRANSERLAEELGISKHLKENGNKTGVLRVVDTETKELRAVISLKKGADEMATEIHKALE